MYTQKVKKIQMELWQFVFIQSSINIEYKNSFLKMFFCFNFGAVVIIQQLIVIFYGIISMISVKSISI